MGVKGFPLTALFLLLIWRITSAQFPRSRGFHSYHGMSEGPCGPGVQSRPSRAQYYPYGRQAGNYYQQGFNPYHAAMMDVDIPPYMVAGGYPGFHARQPPPQQTYYQQPVAYPRQQASSSYAQQFRDLVQRTRSYPQTQAAATSQNYPTVTRRRVKRQAMMFSGMNCQCDSAADCNLMATIRGRAYNYQCQGHLSLVCCCRGA